MTKVDSESSTTFFHKNPVISLTYSGKFTDSTVGASYGVTETAPTGTDGTDFLSVSVGGKDETETLRSETTISINRAAVTNDGLKQGAINIANGASLLAKDSKNFTQDGMVNVTASLSNKKSYYIPIIKSMPVKGGGLSQGTSSVSITGTNPTVTISNSGKFTDVASGGVGTSYGVTTTKPTTGTDGTDFLQIAISGTSNTETFTGSSSIKVSRAAVTHDGTAAGAINWTDGSSILAAISNKEFTASTDNTTQKSVKASVTGGTSYYIPIVSLTNKGTGGVVTASASASIDTYVAPELDYITSGTIINNGMTKYGVSNTVPTSGGYFSLNIEPKLLNNGSVAGTVSGTWSRTAVKSNGTYKGAVSLTTDTQFLAEGSGDITIASFNQILDINWDATVGKRNWYFTEATLGEITGGDLSEGTLTIKGTDPYVTPDINFLSRTDSTNGSAITPSTYGITETAPKTGTWVVFDPTGTPTGATYTGSVSVTRSEASATVTKGLTTGDTKSLASTSKTYSNTKIITPGVKDGTSRYIPVVAPAASVSSHSVTNPTVNCSEETRYFINGTAQTSTLSGILVQNSNPSDFKTASYIKIAPSYTTVKGSSSVTAKASISAGITTGGETTTDTKTELVGVTKGTSDFCFIKVYDGTYSLS